MDTGATSASPEDSIYNCKNLNINNIPAMDCMKISQNKIKYLNKNYQKFPHKIYDSKCDIKLSVGGTSFRVHKQVLSEASDYFSAMFHHDMKEKEQDAIEIKDISPKGFSAILDYFYHGNITICPENIEDVLEVARFFQADWIVDVCCNFLVEYMSLENYTYVQNLADKYALGDLQPDILQVLALSINELVEQPKFLQNLPENLLLAFLQCDVYVEAHEHFLFKIILDWVDEDPCTRKPSLLPLLKEIRFSLMELEELESIPDLVHEFEEIHNEIEFAKNYALCIQAQCLQNDDKFLPRGAHSVLAMIFFPDDICTNIAYKDLDNPGLCVEELDSPLHIRYEHTRETVLGNFLFVAGGYTTNYCSSNCVFMYDPRFRTWTEIASMQNPRVSFAMCSSDHNLFVLGGINHMFVDNNEVEVILQNCEMYFPEENIWVAIPDLPLGIFDHASAFANDCLYCSGGITDNPENTVPVPFLYVYSFSTKTWETKAEMLYPHQRHCMMSIDNKLFVLGGYTRDNEIGFKDCLTNECYDIETNQWTEIISTPPEYGLLQSHATQLENKIYIIGGEKTNLYAYDFEKNTFEELELLDPKIQRVSCLDVAYP
ncbi:kelch 26 isoform X4 [Octopus vulgaris]|uniref:Kelch 26 isoform X4 n=1 Tax=Octopus vulgaris TaxID=6645 RepID=A0AA36EY74_OCTVU|nr:kelch 26 isoform X4 [Octopus vulgaris]